MVQRPEGYGFLTRDDGEKDVFVHYSAIEGQGGFRNLDEGDRVDSVLRRTKGPSATGVSRI